MKHKGSGEQNVPWEKYWVSNSQEAKTRIGRLIAIARIRRASGESFCDGIAWNTTRVVFLASPFGLQQTRLRQLGGLSPLGAKIKRESTFYTKYGAKK